jgi:hypothetical protein
MVPKAQRKAINRLVQNRTCRFCAAPLSSHVTGGNSCTNAILILRELKRKQLKSGALWLAFVKRVGDSNEEQHMPDVQA